MNIDGIETYFSQSYTVFAVFMPKVDDKATKGKEARAPAPIPKKPAGGSDSSSEEDSDSEVRSIQYRCTVHHQNKLSDGHPLNIVLGSTIFAGRIEEKGSCPNSCAIGNGHDNDFSGSNEEATI